LGFLSDSVKKWILIAVAGILAAGLIILAAKNFAAGDEVELDGGAVDSVNASDGTNVADVGIGHGLEGQESNQGIEYVIDAAGDSEDAADNGFPDDYTSAADIVDPIIDTYQMQRFQSSVLDLTFIMPDDWIIVPAPWDLVGYRIWSALETELTFELLAADSGSCREVSVAFMRGEVDAAAFVENAQNKLVELGFGVISASPRVAGAYTWQRFGNLMQWGVELVTVDHFVLAKGGYTVFVTITTPFVGDYLDDILFNFRGALAAR
jgi:hypothetical protein